MAVFITLSSIDRLTEVLLRFDMYLYYLIVSCEEFYDIKQIRSSVKSVFSQVLEKVFTICFIFIVLTLLL